MWLLVCLSSLLGSGCSTVFSKPVMSSTPAGHPWLAGFASAPVETAPTFDLTQIQPARHAGAMPDDLLEITIWDLAEPGQPHTFPSRVDSRGQIVVPHLAAILVTGLSPTEIEAQLSAAYHQQEILKQPRILVRELSSAPIHIYVTGAVLRPGLINLPRSDASVFTALVAAGGLSRNAGLQVYVSEQPSGKQTGQAATSVPDSTMATLVAGNAGMRLPESDVHALAPAKAHLPVQLLLTADEPLAPPVQQLVNHSESVTVSADGHLKSDVDSTESGNPQPSTIEEAVATRPDRSSKSGLHTQPGHWYDLSVDQDRERLKQLVLRDGDMVTVRPSAPPVRITGAVAQPGSYRTPANNTLALNDALQLAGGLGATDLPMIVVLTRPATSEQALERWTFRIGQGEKLPPQTPPVQPGDLVHVEPTAQARVQSLVGTLWPGK